MLKNDANYERYNNVLYRDGIPVLRFLGDSFIDIGPLTSSKAYIKEQALKYMSTYIRMYPHKFELMKPNRSIKKFFYDVETTGINWRRCSIHQLSFIIEIDGIVIEKGTLHIRPHDKADIEQEALSVGGVTEEQIRAYPTMEEQFESLSNTLSKYVDKYDKGDKFHMIGFRNASFDDDFLKKYFDLMKSKFYFYFFSNSLDVSCLATEYLLTIRADMPTFKLSRVAKTLGIDVDDEKLHDADYDVYLTREIYLVVKTTENLM